MKGLYTLIFSLAINLVFGQDGWEWEPLTEMPEGVSNNAVTEGHSGDTLNIYSFTGISAGLTPADIHLKAWRFNTILNEWQSLPDVDDFRGKIATGASTINNVIYLIGGYHVYDNFSEDTSPKVHRFDCETNVWLTEGTPTPVPIDDHVQAVWRDSLIFVVTGWSNSGNVNDVQIYDPSMDTWTAATSVPNNNNFKAFGASGTIIGDTIYYFGGVAGNFAFNANNRMRKGVINPDNPTEITWEQLPDAPGPDGYRMAAVNYENEAIWIGGAPTSYNFDGLAYSNGAGVDPLEQIRLYRTDEIAWETYVPTPYQVMDLRGIAKETEDSWIIAGGMEPNQLVSNRVFRIRRGVGVRTNIVNELAVQLSQDGSVFTVSFEKESNGVVRVIGINGRQQIIQNYAGKELYLDLSSLSTGIYFLQIKSNSAWSNLKIVNP